MLWLFLGMVLTLIRFPYETIKTNNYVHYKFYNTILFQFTKIFFPSLVMVLIVLVVFILLGMIISIVSGKKPKNLLNSKIFKGLPFKMVTIAAAIFLLVLHVLVFMTHLKNGPNILLVVVDTVRADHTAIENYAKDITPGLKAYLMKDGISFRKAFSNAPWTLPSIASLLTSQYPSRINMNHKTSVLESGFITIAEQLKEEGYFTGGIVSHIFVKAKFGLGQGFDIYDENNVSEDSNNLFHVSSPGVTDRAIKFIKKNKNRKFFLFLHYFDPHYSYIDHDHSMSYSGIFSPDVPEFKKAKIIQFGGYKKEDVDYLRYCYDTEIKFTDKHLKRVIEELKKNQIYDNTLIVFTSDHGDEFAERDSLGHGQSVYNELIKIPLVVKLPVQTVKSNVKWSDLLISNLDIFPTITGLLNINTIQKIQGSNIFSKKLEKRMIFCEVNEEKYGQLKNKTCVISGDWKLVKDLVTEEYQLFNITNDPGERENLLKTENRIATNLKLKLGKWIKTNRKQKFNGKKVSLTEEELKKLKQLQYF